MRIAVLADIHGNRPAFEAALDHVAHQRVDQIVLNGDIPIGSPDSKACWDLALSLNCPILRGNHERYVSSFGTPAAAPDWTGERFAPLHWAYAQFTGAERQHMAQLPTTLRLPGAPDLFLTHASERDDHDTVAAHTPEPEIERMFPTARERFIVRSHNHNAQVRVWQRGWIITTGSAGLPLDGHPTAQYLLLDQTRDGWKIQHQSVPYDVDAALRRFEETGYLAAAGPMARLYYREAATASFQIVPFLRAYTQWTKEEPLTLSQALQRFYNHL